jgi:glyoxylase I family protein
MHGRNRKIFGGGFHHVAIRVKDFDASLKFYAEGLGMRQKVAWGEGARRAAMLDSGDGNYVELLGMDPAEPRPEGAVAHFALRTDNCDGAIAAARAAGAAVTMEPKDIPLNSQPPIKVRIAFCKGPDGEVIEFFQNDAT